MLVMLVLKPGDGAEGAVVHHDPHYGYILHRRRGKGGNIGAHAAVADECHHLLVRAGHLHAKGCGRSIPHGGKSAGSHEGTRFINRELLAHAVLVPAYVGDHVPVPGKDLSEVGKDPLGTHGELVRLLCIRNTREIGGLAFGNFLHRFGPLHSFGIQSLRRRQDGVEGHLRITDCAYDRLEVPPDFLLVDVDVDEPCGRNIEGLAEVPGAAVSFGKPCPHRHHNVGFHGGPVVEVGPPESGHTHGKGMIVGNGPFPHEGIENRDLQVGGQDSKSPGGTGGDNAASGIEDRVFRFGQHFRDFLRRLFIQAGLGKKRIVVDPHVEEPGVDLHGENIHGNGNQHGARAAGDRKAKGLVHHLGKELRPVHPPGPLHEGAVNLVLAGICVEVHFLVGMTPEITARDVTCNDHHGDRVQRGLSHAGRGVGDPGAEVSEKHARNPTSLSPGIAVGGMGSYLLMTDGHEMDAAFLERIEETDDGVAAQAKNLLHTTGLEKLHELERNKIFLHILSLHSFFPWCCIIFTEGRELTGTASNQQPVSALEQKPCCPRQR